MASSIVQQRPISAAVHQQARTDEDFINRSLLDQIDTDADTDPVFSSDSEAAGATRGFGAGTGRNFGSSSSQSSVESSGLSYQYQMQVHSQPPPRSDSPNGQRSGLAFAAHNDQYIHTPQQSLYNNQNSEPSSEFSPFPDNDSQTSAASFDAAAFRNNSMFGPFLPPRARPSVGGPPSAGFGHESNTMNYNHYNNLSAADVFGTHQHLSQLAQQQQQQVGGVRGYDFMNEGQAVKPNGKPIFTNMDPFNTSASGATGHVMLQGQQIAKLPQNQPQQPQPMHNYVNQQFPNGMLQAQQQAQPQGHYGPHVPANQSSAMGAPTVSHANGLSNVSVTTQQEEISTIFVVGFPDDMQVCSCVN